MNLENQIIDLDLFKEKFYRQDKVYDGHQYECVDKQKLTTTPGIDTTTRKVQD